MTMTTTQLGRDPAFEPFLGAKVGEDGTGAAVSVLSMLARLEVDPWDEASDLTRMLEAPARERLEALLERFKDVPTELKDRGCVAVTLLAQLPKRQQAPRPHDTSTGVSPPKLALGAPAYWVFAVVLFIGWAVILIQAN